MTHSPTHPLDRTFQPLAIVVPWENGTVPGLPLGFSGPVHRAAPIPGDWRLALRVNGATVFHGGSLHIPLVHGPPDTNGYANAPDVVEIELPTGLVIVAPTQQGGGVGYANVTDVTALPGGGDAPAGYRRLRLVKPAKNEWSYENGDLTLKMAVDASAAGSLTGKTFGLSRVRAYSGAPNQARADNWQPFAVTVARFDPVPQLPARLHTAYCWSGWDEFANDPSRGLDPITMWKDLG
jgi:hypothetical protein